MNLKFAEFCCFKLIPFNDLFTKQDFLNSLIENQYTRDCIFNLYIISFLKFRFCSRIFMIDFQTSSFYDLHFIYNKIFINNTLYYYANTNL